MQILIPIAGPSNFFKPDDYPFPKPLIEVDGKPMIENVIENLDSISGDIEYIFVVPQSFIANFSLDSALKFITNDRCKIVSLKNPTAGALCSCLMAIDEIDEDKPLIIANGDQIINADLKNIIENFKKGKAEAGVISFDSVHPRWSYIQVDKKNEVLQAEEKRVISKNALAGFYYFQKAKSFFDVAMRSIEADQNTNGMYYIAPTLNYLVLDGKKVMSHAIDKDSYHSLYSPAKIAEYESSRLKNMVRNSSNKNPEHKKVNILIPAAGLGSRFAKAGFKKPKPFIDVHGKPMIQHVIDNIKIPNSEITIIFQKEHVEKEPFFVKELERSGINIVTVDGITEGTACTVLQAREYIDNDNPLLIANSDQYVNFSCDDYVQDCFGRGLDGSILVFKDKFKDPKWSFAKLDKSGFLTEVAEKKPISDLATVGIYLFSKGSDFVKAAIDMIARNDRVNNEFYTCPVYNYAVKNGLRFGVYETSFKDMNGLGTPDDLALFLKQNDAKKLKIK